MKTKQSLVILFTAVVSILSPNTTSAFPFGAGSCINGPATLGPGSPHNKTNEGGSWSEGGYQITVNGTNLFLEAAGDNYFRGFLFRLSSKEESAARKMKLLDEYMDISQQMESNGEMIGAPGNCGWKVSGICHTENSNKTKVGVKLMLVKDVEYKMGFTVVKRWNEWYYASRKLVYTGDSIVLGSATNGTKIQNQSAAQTKSPTSPPLSRTNDRSNHVSTVSSAVKVTSEASSSTSQTSLLSAYALLFTACMFVVI